MNGTVIAETWRRNIVNPAVIVYCLLIGIISLGAGILTGASGAISTPLVFLAIVLGCRVIGPEFSSGTLQLILAKPINRSTYLLSRVAGSVLSVWTAAAFVAICNLIGRALGKTPLRVETLGLTLLNVAADVILVIALLALFGSMTRSYFNVAIYVGAQVGIFGALAAYRLVSMARPEVAQFFAWLPKVITWIDMNLFAEAPIDRFDRDWMLVVLSNAAIALVIACFVFRRREVPYGAD